jgi:hypothetical protein
MGTSTPQAKLHLVDTSSNTLRFETLNSSGNSLQKWDVLTEPVAFIVSDSTTGTFPLIIENAAPSDSLLIDRGGSVGIGTPSPQYVGNVALTGNILNVYSKSKPAQVVSEGGLGGTLGLIHLSAPLNQKTFQLHVQNGTASFDVVKDNFSGLAVPSVLNIRMANGNIGLGIAADTTKPLKLKNGASVSTGGVWTNASSREVKQDIEPLTIEQARETVQALNPVGFRYKEEPDEQYLGFIAEDVPELVATNDRKSLAPMDITAVLTKVVQDQEARIERQEQFIDKLTQRLNDLEQKLAEKPAVTN